jgi:uncharacterized protein YktA (UPF0223 family)
MSAHITEYHRLVTIVPKAQKKVIIDWAEKNGYTLTSVVRQALKEFFAKRGLVVS